MQADITELKRLLYLELLKMPSDVMTDQDVDILYNLSSDRAIRDILQQSKKLSTNSIHKHLYGVR